MDQKKKVGNYLLVEKIGQGQFGAVYKGVLIDNQKEAFAIKCILKSKLEGNAILNRLFQTEMSVMSKIKHPNIMHLETFMETNHNYYLVMQYCNNGDLETYLKRMGRLSEDEAVYFLMQIMNGFQVLHSNKIMHRDVKLANIFLNDDQVVIGDFGFAKQGVDVTRTKLGTPITMAPELLNSDGGSYTSKTDLWSIGVCFYQILFGKTPFEAKSYDELKQKVKTQSGKNLTFLKDVVISKECKDLLISLLQFDPIKRIEWKNFFNHPLFELHSKKKSNGFPDITQSMFERQNEEKVKNEFSKNKVTVINNPDLIQPEQMVPEVVNRNNTQEEAIPQNICYDETANLNESFKVIRARYCHEKKKIIFMMYAVRKVRNLAKQKNLYGDLINEFMYLACILLKKGLTMNTDIIRSLSTKENIYNLKDFSSFCSTEEAQKIRKNFDEDDKIYKTFSQQMNSKIKEEISSNEYKQRTSYYNDLERPNIQELDEILIRTFKFTKSKLNQIKIMDPNYSELISGMVNLYFSIFSEEKLFFEKNGLSFEWRTFENDLRPDNLKNMYNNIII